MLGLDNKENIKCPDEDGVRLIVLVIETVDHIEEVLDVFSLRRQVEVSAYLMSVAICC